MSHSLWSVDLFRPRGMGRLVTSQLLSYQTELEELRMQRRQSVETVRDKEEALEQTEEKERRARAEVDSLRCVDLPGDPKMAGK